MRGVPVAEEQPQGGPGYDATQEGPVDLPPQPMVRLDVPAARRRWGSRPPQDAQRRPPWLLPAVAAAAASVATLAVVGALAEDRPGRTAYPVGGLEPVIPAPAPASPLSPQPLPDEPSPTFGDLCHPDEVTLKLTSPAPAWHDTATTMTATNTGGRTCRVEGWPTLALRSAGEDLALFVHVAELDPVEGEHVEAVPVALAPGEMAETQVWWPAWGAAADVEAEQVLSVGIGGGLEVVDLAPAQRWDVVRSAEVWVAPWQPAR